MSDLYCAIMTEETVNVIKDFLRLEKNSTLFLIEAINGVKISGYTEYENENEAIEFSKKVLNNRTPESFNTKIEYSVPSYEE